MTNTIVQKMANDKFVYLTPDHKYIFMGKTFTRLKDCYAYEIEIHEKQPSTRDTWVRDMIKKHRGF
ncbi:MAG: hypothetical protein PWQ43_751 [Rikenellaceae bacterium]|nr:hypothetical protein [Rikenellaceae bacterium]